jgi:hypothetical protein
LGQGASRDDQEQLFAEGISRVPLHFPLHYKYFNAVTAKWGGSHKEMFAFVRDRTKGVPHGHAMHCLVSAAYNELALSIASDRDVDAAFTTLRQPQYAKEVAAALYAWLSATPKNLSEKLMNVGGGFASFGLNNFGVALYICGAKNEAKEVLCALNGEIESVPWAWIGKGSKARNNPAFVYDRACEELGIALPQ